MWVATQPSTEKEVNLFRLTRQFVYRFGAVVLCNMRRRCTSVSLHFCCLSLCYLRMIVARSRRCCTIEE